MDDFGSFSYFRGRRFDIPSPTAKPQAKKPLPRKHEEGSVSDLSDLEGEEGTPTLIPNQFGTFVDFASSTAFLEEFAHLREESQEITKKFSMLRRKTLHNNSTPGSPQISRHTSEVLIPSAGTLDEFTSLYKQMLIKKNEQIALMQKKRNGGRKEVRRSFGGIAIKIDRNRGEASVCGNTGNVCRRGRCTVNRRHTAFENYALSSIPSRSNLAGSSGVTTTACSNKTAIVYHGKLIESQFSKGNR
eukprot:PhF_6_TR12875/c0_g1_i1/m.20245